MVIVPWSPETAGWNRATSAAAAGVSGVSGERVKEQDESQSPNPPLPEVASDVGSTSRQACRFFARSGWCRFGYKCRFAHVSKTSAHREREESSKVKENEGAKLVLAGDSEERQEDVSNGTISASAPHPSVTDGNDVPDPELEKDAHSRRSASQRKVCYFYAKGYCRMGKRCRFLHEAKGSALKEQHQEQHQEDSKDIQAQDSRDVEDGGDWKPAKKPISAGAVMSRVLAELEDGEAAGMRETEISQLKKRFPGDKLEVVGPETDNPSYRFTVVPTDPDWPYDLKDFEVQVTFPQEYPVQPAQLILPEDQVLPSIILRHISEAVNEWLEARYATSKLSGRVELVIRPFLRWFDRNLMRLFTEGARKFKKEVYAKAAGFEFISYAKPEESEAASPPDHGDSDSLAHPKEKFINQELDGQDEDDDEEYDDDDEEYDDNDDDEEEKEEGVDDDEEEVDNDQEDLETRASTVSALSTSPRDEVPSQPDSSSKYVSPTENRRGTEIRFPHLEMSESAATLACQKIKLRVQCARCREHTDLSVAPGRAMVLGCAKCQTQQAVGFRPCIIHQFSSVLGFLDLTGCAPVDLIVYDCGFLVSCLGCSGETSLQGIQYGQNRMVWCSKCHQKMSIAMEPAKFKKLVASVPEGKVEVVSVKKDRRVKDPAIREGFPLPANGACKHYKKSFRWLRFPCCGKCYPCDECHDLAELDHEMTFASRMICGFCSKEQPYSMDKPCQGCGSNTTKSRTTHWEGGTGCRNKTKMNRSDKQKYTSLAKTTSRKAQKLEDLKKGKKNK